MWFFNDFWSIFLFCLSQLKLNNWKKDNFFLSEQMSKLSSEPYSNFPPSPHRGHRRLALGKAPYSGSDISGHVPQLRPKAYERLPYLTWYTVLSLQPGKLKRMSTDCYKLRVDLCVYSRYTHTVGLVCCYEVQWSKKALSSPEVWVRARQLQRGKWLEAPGHNVNIENRKLVLRVINGTPVAFYTMGTLLCDQCIVLWMLQGLSYNF